MFSGLAGKAEVVTGGAGGLGSASARRLSAEGCRVVDAYLRASELPDLDATEFNRGMAVNVPGAFLGLRGAGAWDFAALDARTYGGEEQPGV